MFNNKRMRLTVIILIGILVAIAIGSVIYKQVNTLNYKHRNDYVLLSFTDNGEIIVNTETPYLFVFDKRIYNDDFDDYLQVHSYTYESVNIELFRKDKVFERESSYPYFLNEISRGKIKVYKIVIGNQQGTYFVAKLKDLKLDIQENKAIAYTFRENSSVGD